VPQSDTFNLVLYTINQSRHTVWGGGARASSASMAQRFWLLPHNQGAESTHTAILGHV